MNSLEMPAVARPRAETRLPRVLIVGGDDVHFRIELMRSLSADFSVAAAGCEPSLRERFERNGFGYHEYPMKRGFNPWSELRALRKLEGLIRRLRPDIVHAFATKPAVWGRLAAARAGVPIVVGTLPGLGTLYALNDRRTRVVRPVYEWLQRRASWGSDATILQNYDDAHLLLEAGITPADRTHLILGSGVRTDVFDPERVSPVRRAITRSEFRTREGRIVIMMVSRLIRSKGVMEFARAAQELSRVRSDLDFVLVGPDDHGRLDSLTAAEREELAGSVWWAGHRSDIREILSIADVFVLPSNYREGIPRVLLEAASMGRPIITTRTPGCSEVVEEERNGILIPPGDARALREAIDHLASAPGARVEFGHASRRIAVERFDLNIIAAQTASLYRYLLRERRRGRAA